MSQNVVMNNAKLLTAVAGVLLLASCNAAVPGEMAHRRAAAPTGSLLSGADTGADENGSIADPSIRSNLEAGAPNN